MPDQQPAHERLVLAKEYEKLSFSPGVGLSLGVWAGRGDWAKTSAAHRDREGHRALTELDELISQLTLFRQRLAGAVGPVEPAEPNLEPNKTGDSFGRGRP